ncbi:MAG: 4-diphosphocytidyl-2-C-methyl-D-erythritol kinase [Clostridia bacterium]|nr:4-diphosphocytidyl-2-C-methyl-D-erythritol kinase [Clostridia bacterium]
MDVLELPAYAKINLTLRVLGRRPDGFHDISTIFQTMALHDTLSIQRAETGIHLEVEGAPLPAGPDNLVYQAARLLQQRYGSPGARITLVKRIPIAAGLAGGSADAAAALLGLNYLYNLGLTPGQLAREGASLGSDVPFCLLGGTALGRGRGEELTLLPSPPVLWLVLVPPPFGVSTAAIYRAWDASPDWRARAVPGEEEALAAIKAGDRERLIGALGNDLEGVTASLYPEVGSIKSRLLAAGAEGALMCGSGPVVCGIAPDREAAGRIAARLKETYPATIVTRTL